MELQQRTLIRTRGLASFRQALVALAIDGGPAAARRRVVVVPTRASGELLRQTIERHAAAIRTSGVVLPDLLTRDEWLARLHTALPAGPRWLARIEREVLIERAARDTLRLRRYRDSPFHLRPGLVSAMLDFYDELRRRQRTVRRFARVLFDELRVERGTDRGSEELIAQTGFLGFTFLAYQRGVAASGGIDEHELRAALFEGQPLLPCDDLVMAVADHPADPRGFWPADFDLVGRLRGLRRVHVVMTDEAHDAGFRERLERELPGIEEVRADDRPWAPVIVTSEQDHPDGPVMVRRDREDELREVARTIRQRARAAGGAVPPTAVVFQRPLPYLYLARQVLADARVPYQAFDALPLAAEPYAALLDLVLAMARTGGTREAAVALLRSTLVAFDVDGERVGRADVSALDAVLAERRAMGDARTYPDEVEAFARVHAGRQRALVARARRAARAALASRDALEPFREASRASAQIRALADFLRTRERAVTGGDEGDGRFHRARAAVLAVLDGLTEACARHDDRPRTHETLAAMIHHAIEARTFTPRTGATGVHLVDAAAARFGEFDDVYLVGLVETDWAERVHRTFFYASSLLKTLGWPQESEQTLARQAAFQDVLALARVRTRLSAFQLEGDAIVGLSPMVDVAGDRPSIVEPPDGYVELFDDEALTRGLAPAALDAAAAAWFSLRRRRPPLSAREYGGFVAARAPEVYRVSRVDRYVVCPFKYFAEHVLRLPEERDELAGLTPLERGNLLHALLEHFYRSWHEEGRGAITPDNLDEAEQTFARLADEALAGVPDPDRVLEEMRLLGSLVDPGVAMRVLELEAGLGAAVADRLIEADFSGPFTFPVHHGLDSRTIEIRGKTDRIDILADGSLRVIDYKLGRMPDLKSSIQVAVYAHCARQWLERRDGVPHPVSAASYIAFGADGEIEGRIARGPADTDHAVAARAGEFAGVVARIEAGEFPPQPRRTSECQWCGYAGVCRKEYRLEDDEAAESV